ncbi:hypothetical protein SCUCBS95973_004854 [Sporothrix curviconia]|uniref:Uncharacterized protein n=1 Tax=Sporothrix curviconia TaxID=1260050 RepID=A0ABP0BSF7_9PEZI
MAFHQPTRQTVQRPPRQQSEEQADNRVPAVLPAALEESQTWVLFSPAADTATTSSILDSLPASSQQTAGRSRLSDLGSLRSLEPSNYASSYAAQSALARPARPNLSYLSSVQSRTNEEAVESDDDGRPDVEEDAELDSLDSHLPDFRPTQNQTQGQQVPSHMTATATTTVNLPTHDGLGSFRLGNVVGMSAAVQEHLYSFEQFNPRRVTKRRRESLDLAQLQAADQFTEDIERTRRIEAWRWEHSRVLLEEIQKETRRRRGSELSARRSRPGAAAPTTASAPGATAADTAAQPETGCDWHEQEEDERLSKFCTAAGEDGAEANEGLWTRITRKFMLEVMGIDDRVLSVLFGEDLVGEELGDDGMDLSSTPRASNPLLEATAAGITAEDERAHEDSSSWQLRMLERIAKELGILVHSHTNAHPGAFSTFTCVQQMPLPYAGLPVIPEGMASVNRDGVLGSEREASPAHSSEKMVDDVTPTGTTASLPRFKPTIYQAPPMAIPGQAAEPTTAAGPSESTAARSASSGATAAPPTFTQDEWEQDLDIKLVFRYLRSRFFSGSGSASNHAHRHHLHHHALHAHGLGSNPTNMSNMQDAAAKVARVRQHHPLVGRGSAAARQTGGERRPMPAFRNMNAPGVAAPLSPILGMRHGHGTATSCASQSTRRSARRSSISSRHSSRHYWDIGGSIGTGSMIASAGPMGSWGEV